MATSDSPIPASQGATQESSKALSWSFYLIVGILFLLGGAFRVANITLWPIPFHQTSQYENAIGARHFWMKATWDQQGELEKDWYEKSGRSFMAPPILQYMMATFYRCLGGEAPWVSNIINSVFWLLGGIFLLLACRAYDPHRGFALAALAIYLFMPLGIIVSHTFQPEASLASGFCLVLWRLTARKDDFTVRTTVVTGLISAAVNLLKPGPLLFPLTGAFFALSYQNRGLRKTLFSAPLYLFAILSVAPSLLYAALFLEGHLDQKFIPSLFGEAFLYQQWWDKIGYAVTKPGMVIALVGALAAVIARLDLGFGLVLGYLGYMLFFNWHTATHHYYHVPLVVVVAVNFGLLWAALDRFWLWRKVPRILQGVLPVFYVMQFALHDYQMTTWQAREWPKTIAQNDTIHATIERTIPKGATTLILDSFTYGYPARYHCWIQGVPWPSVFDMNLELRRLGKISTQSERWQDFLTKYAPSYFVVADTAEWQQQPNLRKIVENYPRLHDRPDLIIFDLRSSPAK